MRLGEGTPGPETNQPGFTTQLLLSSWNIPASSIPSLSAEPVLTTYLQRQCSFWPLALAEQWHYAMHKEYPGNRDRHGLIRSVPGGF